MAVPISLRGGGRLTEYCGTQWSGSPVERRVSKGEWRDEKMQQHASISSGLKSTAGLLRVSPAEALWRQTHPVWPTVWHDGADRVAGS